MPEPIRHRNLIAILRGITPGEAVPITEVLVEQGFRMIEVPMNSPEPLESISRMVAAGLPDDVQIGAGTVLSLEEVDAVTDAGGRFVVSPDCNPAVIRHTKSIGLGSWPGVFTATECLTALRNGADGLKLFPGFLLGPEGLEALKAVLPPATPLYAVGGVGADNFSEWMAAGATGFGIGSSLYSPGATTDDVRRSARALIEAYDSSCSKFEVAA